MLLVSVSWLMSAISWCPSRVTSNALAARTGNEPVDGHLHLKLQSLHDDSCDVRLKPDTTCNVRLKPDTTPMAGKFAEEPAAAAVFHVLQLDRQAVRVGQIQLRRAAFGAAAIRHPQRDVGDEWCAALPFLLLQPVADEQSS